MKILSCKINILSHGIYRWQSSQLSLWLEKEGVCVIMAYFAERANLLVSWVVGEDKNETAGGSSMMKFITLVLCIAMVCGMTGIVFAEAEKPLIGILAPAITHGWVGGVSYYAEEKAKELNLNYAIYTSSNANEMTAQLDDLMAQGVKSIVIFPQWTGMEAPVQMAIDAGVNVVNFDIKIDVEGGYQLSGDNKDMGVQGARYIKEKLGGKGKVVILDVPTSGSVAALRKEGFEETIAEIAPDVEIIGTYITEFTQEAGLRDMTDILVAHSEIDAVYSMDDETSIGAIQAIIDAGRTDIKVITGGGGCQEYFNMMLEYPDLWVQSATYSPSMVQECVQMAIDLAEGKDVESEVIIPTTIVDRENCDQFLNPASPY